MARQARSLIFSEQSFAQVTRENQSDKDIPFHTWTVNPGQWGGRLPPENAGPITPLEQTSVTSVQPLLQEWLDSSESSPFSQHPPDSLMSAVQDILLCETATMHNTLPNISYITATLPLLSPCQSLLLEYTRFRRHWSQIRHLSGA